MSIRLPSDSLSEEDRKAYFRYLESLSLSQSVLWSSRVLGFDEGEKIGREKGRAEGEKKASLENARKMKLKGFSVEDIIDVTGLSKNEIENLR